MKCKSLALHLSLFIYLSLVVFLVVSSQSQPLPSSMAHGIRVRHVCDTPTPTPAHTHTSNIMINMQPNLLMILCLWSVCIPIIEIIDCTQIGFHLPSSFRGSIGVDVTQIHSIYLCAGMYDNGDTLSHYLFHYLAGVRRPLVAEPSRVSMH